LCEGEAAVLARRWRDLPHPPTMILDWV